MVQAPQTTWGQYDPIYTNHASSIAFKVYLVFIVLSLAAAAVHLVKSLRSRRQSGAEIEQSTSPLQRRASSLGKWITLNFLVWVMLTCIELRPILKTTFLRRTFEAILFLPFIVDALQTLTLTLWVTIILYLTRWYILRRTERSVNPR
jgi:hypothetical protein